MFYFKKWPFRVIPETSAEIWAGRQLLYATLERLFIRGLSRGRSAFYCMWGYLGAGKSHSLIHFSNKMKNEGYYCIVSPFPRTLKSYFDIYYHGFLSAVDSLDIIKYASLLYQKKSEGNLDPNQMDILLFFNEHITNNWLDMSVVLSKLGRQYTLTDNIRDPLCLAALRWLSGGRISRTELNSLGVSNSLKEDYDYVRATQCIIRLLTYSDIEIQHKKGFFWIMDDCHYLGTLRTKRDMKKLNLIQQSIRDVFDGCPDNLLLLLSFTTRDSSTVESLLISDIKTRISQRIEVPPFTVEQAHQFVLDLINHSMFSKDNTKNSYYPYTETSLNHAIKLISEVTDLTPRNVMKFFDQITLRAEDEIYPKTISVDIVDDYKDYSIFSST
jgi:hypothetical protein